MANTTYCYCVGPSLRARVFTTTAIRTASWSVWTASCKRHVMSGRPSPTTDRTTKWSPSPRVFSKRTSLLTSMVLIWFSNRFFESNPNFPTLNLTLDIIGLHRIENTSHTKVAVSLHVYVPPYAECQGFDEKTGKSKTCKVTFYSKYGQKVIDGSV